MILSLYPELSEHLIIGFQLRRSRHRLFLHGTKMMAEWLVFFTDFDKCNIRSRHLVLAFFSKLQVSPCYKTLVANFTDITKS